MGQFAEEAARPMAPTANSGVTHTALSTASTAAVDTGLAGGFIQMVADADFYILFGDASMSAVTTTTGMKYPAGVLIERWVSQHNPYFRAILASGAGTLDWCRG